MGMFVSREHGMERW